MGFTRWVRGVNVVTISAPAAESIVDLGDDLHNNSVERQEWTIVRGFYTLKTNSEVSFARVCLFVVNENLTPADFSDTIPPYDDPAIFLYMHAGSQRSVEIKSGKTIKMNQHVLLRTDIVNSSAVTVLFGWEMFLVIH